MNETPPSCCYFDKLHTLGIDSEMCALDKG
jgi:hypothetical protein